MGSTWVARLSGIRSVVAVFGVQDIKTMTILATRDDSL